MKHILDDELATFKDEFRVKESAKKQLKQKIMVKSRLKPLHSTKKYWFTVAAVLAMLFFTSPFYSTTMADLAAKVLPLDIQPSFSETELDPQILGQLQKVIKDKGYEFSFIGTTPSPFTVEIGLVLMDSELNKAKEQLTPYLEEALYNNGIDNYLLNITNEEAIAELPEKWSEMDDVYQPVRQIVYDAFASYGYEEEANYELVRLEETWFSYILQLDMPDHITEHEEILADIQDKIKEHDLDIKDIEVHMFNFEHRRQDNRWAYIASDIYQALAGKSKYKVTGLSYKVKEGHSYVWIDTEWHEKPPVEVIEEIESAIQRYTSLTEVKEQIEDDPYTIQFLLENEEVFLTLTP